MTTTSQPPTIATHPLTNHSLAALRGVAFLEPYFKMLDAGEPAAWNVSEILFSEAQDASKRETAREFAIAVLRERCGAELTDEDELTELGLIEMLDPAKGFPPQELRYKAALLVLATPTASDGDALDNIYLAHYLTDEPNIGLAVSMNDIRAQHGLEPTGW